MSIKNFFNFKASELFKFQKIDENLKNLDNCVEVVLNFLKDNQIDSWDEFQSTTKFDRFVVDKIIDSYCENIEDLKEVRFKLKLKLSNLIQLREILKEYEELEEYEKCSEIKSEIKKRIN